MKRLINLVFHIVFGSLILAVLILGYKQANAQTAARLDSRLALLRAPGPPISGKSLVGVPRLPPHLRGATLSQLHVLCRLRAAAGAPVPSSLQGTPELLAFLDDGCGGLLEQLHAEWYEGDSLKAPYAQKRGK